MLRAKTKLLHLLRQSPFVAIKTNPAFLTCLGIYLYILLYVYAITTNLNPIVTACITCATINNSLIIAAAFHNRTKIIQLIEAMAKIITSCEQINVPYDLKKSLFPFKKNLAFACQFSVALVFALVSFIPLPSKAVLIITHLFNGIVLTNIISLLSFSGHFFKQLKKATDTDLEQLTRVHLQICKFTKAVHEVFYIPIHIATLAEVVYCYISAIASYFAFVHLLTHGVSFDVCLLLVLSSLVLTSACIYGFYMVDYYAYVSFKANTLAMTIINLCGLQIEQWSLRLHQRELSFYYTNVIKINRGLLYSIAGSVITTLIAVVEYHQNHKQHN